MRRNTDCCGFIKFAVMFAFCSKLFLQSAGPVAPWYAPCAPAQNNIREARLQKRAAAGIHSQHGVTATAV